MDTMTLAGDRLEACVLDYLQTARDKSDVATRERAVRYVTGEMDALPSEVSATITRMIAAGTLVERHDGQLVQKRG